MAASALSPRRTPREAQNRPQRAARLRKRPLAHTADPPSVLEHLSLPLLAVGWQSAFDAAQSALTAAADTLPAEELRERASRLSAERADAGRLLDGLARDHWAAERFAYLAVSPHDLRRLLGLPDAVSACVVTLDGVLVPSAALHAAAWAKTFDTFLFAQRELADHPFRPFDRSRDYAHVHARPRRDGVRSFLSSRGISLPEGKSDDPPGSPTVCGLANQKAALLLNRLEAEPLAAYAGSRQYLEVARAAHIRRAVVSASANARLMLERAGLANLVEECVDGNAMVRDALRAKPAPDTLLAACRRLGVAPEHAAAFETTAAGIAAARSAGVAFVVAVASDENAHEHRLAGADVVVSGLADLLADELAA